MRQRTETIGTGQIQIQQQQIRARMLLEDVEQARDTVGLVELAIGAGCRDRAPQCGAIQRMIVDDEDFVAYPRTRGHRAVSRRLVQMYCLIHSTPLPHAPRNAAAAAAGSSGSVLASGRQSAATTLVAASKSQLRFRRPTPCLAGA